MTKSVLGKYKQYVSTRLSRLSTVFQKYALGDFSESIEIPEKEDEFTELLVGLNLMIEDLRELISTQTVAIARTFTATNEINDTIMKVARGDYSAQLELSSKNDEFDSIAMGLNMMIDEIRTNTEERERLIQELQESLAKVNTLSGLLPICAWCKKLRDDEGYWKSVEEYISAHTGAEFTHGMCPECYNKFIAEEDSKHNIKVKDS